MEKLDTTQKLRILEKLSSISQNSFFILNVKSSSITWLSEQSEERFGYTANQIHTMNSEELADLIHPDDRPALSKSLEKALILKDQEVLTREYRIKECNGTYHWLQDRLTPYSRDSSGNIVEVVAIVTNMDEQKAREASLNNTMEKLLSSAKMAALGEMSGGIAHEINNPLTVIQARAFQLSQMVENNNLDPDKIKQAADSISRTADKIAKIIKSLRAFAREGTNDPFELISVSQIIEETLEFCRTRFYNNGVDVEVLPIDGDLEIECRLIQIAQVLLNLLNNAFDAIRDLEEKWVRISVQENEETIEIHVIDSGKGIPENVASQIMNPFFTTKETGKGTGLGLSISTGIVRAHQGELFLKKEAPNTTFVIRLPKWQFKDD